MLGNFRFGTAIRTADGPPKVVAGVPAAVSTTANPSLVSNRIRCPVRAASDATVSATPSQVPCSSA